MSHNQAISNGSGTEHVTIQYITLIPAIDLFGKSPVARNDIANGAVVITPQLCGPNHMRGRPAAKLSRNPCFSATTGMADCNAGNPAEVGFSLVLRDLNPSLKIRCPRLARSDYLSAL
jgi:hypothetical protein